jgi:hypothetical protein
VWELLADPALYDVWWDARTVGIEPEGTATPGQVVHAKTVGLGRMWDVTLRVEAVDPAQHQVRLHITLPLGIINDNTITCTAVDAHSCRVAFGRDFTLPPGWRGWMLATFGAGLFERNVQDGLQRLKRAAEARHRDRLAG